MTCCKKLQGSSIQYSVMTYMRKEILKSRYMYNLFTVTLEANTTIFQLKKPNTKRYIQSSTAALFPTVKTQKQPKCPLMGKSIKECGIYNKMIIQTLRKVKSCHLRQCEWALRALHQNQINYIESKKLNKTNTTWSHLHVETRNKRKLSSQKIGGKEKDG